MFINVVPAGALEILLFLALLGSFVFVAYRVSRRTSYLASLASPEDLPRLLTAFRAGVTIRRLFRDREQDVILAEGLFGERLYTFCASDFPSRSKVYEASLRHSATIALYALSSLKGAEPTSESSDGGAIGTAEAILLTASGPRPNDYQLRGRVVSHRTGDLDGQTVDVYTFGGSGIAIEVAAKAVPGNAPFADGSLVAGTARLYGYLPDEAQKTPASSEI